jgi:hypothetical protein
MPLKVIKSSNTIADDLANQMLAMSDSDLLELGEFASAMPKELYYDLADAIEVDSLADVA